MVNYHRYGKTRVNLPFGDGYSLTEGEYRGLLIEVYFKLDMEQIPGFFQGTWSTNGGFKAYWGKFTAGDAMDISSHWG